MNECSVCGKQIPEPATECSIRCLQEVGQQSMAGISKARSAFTQAFQKMMTPDAGRLPKLPEVPMICVKHRWMKNRNLVQGTVIFSFDKEGMARIPDQGDNRRTVDFIVAGSRGLMRLWEKEKTVETTPVSPPKQPAPLLKPKPVVAPKSHVDVPSEKIGVTLVEEEVVTSAIPVEEEKSMPKVPPKKSTKKAPGKKSSFKK